MYLSLGERIRELTDRLNRHRHEYYNLNTPTVSDAVYDRLFDELVLLEQQAGVRFSNSPTQTVGYTVVDGLEKTNHPTPLLSLDKTKDISELMRFIGTQPVLVMHKLDGLTLKLEYEDGKLIRASTRGDGDTGELVTHNARAISGIPDRIGYPERLVVVGEVYIPKATFERLKDTLLDSSGRAYKNARNMAAGSVRNFDAAACAQRGLVFTPFNVLEGLDTTDSKNQRLLALQRFGFALCACCLLTAPSQNEVESVIDELRAVAKEEGVPIDGIVATYDNIPYSKSCGRTGHHYKDGIAVKFEDNLYETVLQSIEWTPSRFGEITPVAVFETVEIDGCDVSRASLHNLTFIKRLELVPGCRVLVSKRNMIIPHIEENLDRGGQIDETVPTRCPCCGEPTRIHESTDRARVIETLHCDNPNCDTRRLRQFVHFVSKKAMDIEGLSEATLEKVIGNGWLHTFMDIYRLDEHAEDICNMDGFGEKAWQRLWDAIQRSRNTTFARYLISMDIPMIGRSASKELARVFSGDLSAFETAVDSGYDFTQLPDFGETLHRNIHAWFRAEENRILWEELQTMLNIEKNYQQDIEVADNPFIGKTIVVTGKVEPYTRSGINAKIESLGAHAGGSVSKNTDYLICGENAGSKLSKAQALGVAVLTPQEFFAMVGEA